MTAASDSTGQGSNHRRGFGLIAFAAALFAIPLLVLLSGGGVTRMSVRSFDAGSWSAPRLLAAYQRAGAREGIDWSIIAAIGKVECDLGRSPLAGCNPVGSVNLAGASGPMQFIPSTWRVGALPGISPPPGPPTKKDSDGYASDGDGDGVADIWNVDDAALAAARLLRANGAPGDYPRAVSAYNHSDAYVQRVLKLAEYYRGGWPVSGAGSSPGDWTLRYLGTPYVWGGNHIKPEAELGGALPAPQVGRDGRVGFFDCSSLISWAFAKSRGIWIGGTTVEQWEKAGVTPGVLRGRGLPPGGWQPGDIGFYGTASHVVLALSSTHYIDVAHTGADVAIGPFSHRLQPYGYARYPEATPTDKRNP